MSECIESLVNNQGLAESLDELIRVLYNQVLRSNLDIQGRPSRVRRVGTHTDEQSRLSLLFAREAHDFLSDHIIGKRICGHHFLLESALLLVDISIGSGCRSSQCAGSPIVGPRRSLSHIVVKQCRNSSCVLARLRPHVHECINLVHVHFSL